MLRGGARRQFLFPVFAPCPWFTEVYSEGKIRVRFPDPDKSLFLCSLSRALLIPTSLPVQAQLCQPEAWAGPARRLPALCRLLGAVGS